MIDGNPESSVGQRDRDPSPTGAGPGAGMVPVILKHAGWCGLAGLLCEDDWQVMGNGRLHLCEVRICRLDSSYLEITAEAGREKSC